MNKVHNGIFGCCDILNGFFWDVRLLWSNIVRILIRVRINIEEYYWTLRSTISVTSINESQRGWLCVIDTGNRNGAIMMTKRPSSLDLSWCQACPANTSHMFRGVMLACTAQIICISHITFPDRRYPVKLMSGKTGSIKLLCRYVSTTFLIGCTKQTLWLLWNNELLFVFQSWLTYI